MNTKTVGVVGGGLAGLSAAYRLLLDGDLDVNLFESRPTLGGRVQSRPVRGRMIDFGGFLIYPWYEETHRLLSDIGLADALEKTPLNDIYYFLAADSAGSTEGKIPFPLADGLNVWAKSLLKILPSSEIARPDLGRFDGRTVSQYLRDTLNMPEHGGLFETYFDTVCQGYGYGPATKTKAAFMAPIVRQVMLHGDVRSTSYLPNGGKELVDRLEREIISLGGRIHRGTPVTGIDGRAVQTERHAFAFDAIVFAQPADDALYRSMFPETKAAGCWYTRFLTVAVELDGVPSVADTNNWGAAFYAPDETMPSQALSAINLASLYGPELSGCVMLNVIIRDRPHNASLTDANFLSIARKEAARLFPGVPVRAILSHVSWEKTMPVVQESFVRAVREQNGRDGYYFAGDFLGAPSIETAVATGAAAAAAILKQDGSTVSPQRGDR
ncbi:FAD-dependent oxidoreductase [bacterium]|nr:FAD-dependent oxidoreductase [bacterium]